MMKKIITFGIIFAIIIGIGYCCFVAFLNNIKPEIAYEEPKSDLFLSQIVDQVKSEEDVSFTYQYRIDRKGAEASGTEDTYDDYLDYLDKLFELFKNEKLQPVKMPDAKSYQNSMEKFMQEEYDNNEYSIWIPIEYQPNGKANEEIVYPCHIVINIDNNGKCYVVVTYKIDDRPSYYHVYYLQNIDTAKKIKSVTDDFSKQSKIIFYTMEP